MLTRVLLIFTFLALPAAAQNPPPDAVATFDALCQPVRKERNRILRDLAAARNLAFRDSMVGRTFSAVTLHEPGIAVTGNYLKVELAHPREANRLVDLRIAAVTPAGLCEGADAASRVV